MRYGTSQRRSSKKFHKPKAKWSPEEDKLLISAVEANGPTKWDQIAKNIEGRTGKQCRERWLANLDPKINSSPFTRDEDELIIHLHGKYGNQWKKISGFIIGRTDIAIKNRWRSLRRKMLCIENYNSSKNSDSTSLDIDELLNSLHGLHSNDLNIYSFNENEIDFMFNEFI